MLRKVLSSRIASARLLSAKNSPPVALLRSAPREWIMQIRFVRLCTVCSAIGKLMLARSGNPLLGSSGISGSDSAEASVSSGGATVLLLYPASASPFSTFSTISVSMRSLKLRTAFLSRVKKSIWYLQPGTPRDFTSAPVSSPIFCASALRWLFSILNLISI